MKLNLRNRKEKLDQNLQVFKEKDLSNIWNKSRDKNYKDLGRVNLIHNLHNHNKDVLICQNKKHV